jgi:uncharacterized protein YciI
MHYLLLYELAPDYLDRRGEFRDRHLALAWESVERGELLLGGALSDPADAAVLLFQAGSSELPAAFAMSDPYVKNGLVTKWSVRAWQTVVGEQASNPVHPG